MQFLFKLQFLIFSHWVAWRASRLRQSERRTAFDLLLALWKHVVSRSKRFLKYRWLGWTGTQFKLRLSSSTFLLWIKSEWRSRLLLLFFLRLNLHRLLIETLTDFISFEWILLLYLNNVLFSRCWLGRGLLSRSKRITKYKARSWVLCKIKLRNYWFAFLLKLRKRSEDIFTLFRRLSEHIFSRRSFTFKWFKFEFFALLSNDRFLEWVELRFLLFLNPSCKGWRRLNIIWLAHERILFLFSFSLS
jgi:hypothetical protein